MKNQNDLIVTIVALVVGLGVGLGFFLGRRTVTKPADPQPVSVAPAKPQAGAVVFGTSLPGGTGGGTGGAGGGSRGPSAPSGSGNGQIHKLGPIGAAG